MKKVIYSIALSAIALVGCDPVEDIREEIKNNPTPIVDDLQITLSDDDYKLADNDDIAKFKSFGSEEQAKEFIPVILGNKYPVLGKGSLANVTYNSYESNKIGTELEAYTVTEEDYKSLGFKYNNFENLNDLLTLLNTKFPDVKRGDFMDVSYTFRENGENSDLTTTFIFLSTILEKEELTDEQYDEMNNRFKNFSDHNQASKNIIIAIELDEAAKKAENPYSYDLKEGTQRVVTYVYTYQQDKLDADGNPLKDENGDTIQERKFSDHISVVSFTNNEWVALGNTVHRSFKFGHNGTKWAPDNTIQYALTAEDYALVGNDRYNNFDVRSGKDDESEEARLEKFAKILANNFPDTPEDQKYLVFYKIYNGANDIWTMHVILKDGAYVIVE